MPTRSQPNETFEYNVGLFNETPDDLRAFKDQVDLKIGPPFILREPGASGSPVIANYHQFIDLTNLDVNQKNGLSINLQTTNEVGTIAANGISIYIFTPPDNGGDASGIHVNQTGGGNAGSFFHFTQDRPSGFTDYSIVGNGYAIEAAANGANVVVLSQPQTGCAYRAHLGRITLGDTGGIGFQVLPGADTLADSRAFQILDASSINETFFVTVGGNLVTSTGTGSFARLGLGTLAHATAHLHVKGAPPSFLFETTGTTGKGRVSSVVGNWFGLTVNSGWNGSSWDLDDTAKDGMFAKLDVRGGGNDGFSVWRIPAGANPHTDEVNLFQITPSGNTTASPPGDWIFNAGGKDILPNTNYDQNLGALTKKYLTLHAAELWVETLVAQDTMATIGGRILVGPTTVLTSDLAAADTSIIVKHNQMASGDRVYMEANGKVEFMAITSAPSGVGPYTYTVTRNLDGSGANDWNAGDAVFNTGTTGDGFLDIYSLRGVKSSSQIGPTIVGNIRNSATYNDWSEAWAIGNLNGLYGYGTDIYGVGFGKYADGQTRITIDEANGYRIIQGKTSPAVLGQWDITGNLKLGTNINAAATTKVFISNASQTYNSEAGYVAGDVLLGDNTVASNFANIKITAGVMRFRTGVTDYLTLSTSGLIVTNQTLQIKNAAGAPMTLKTFAASGGVTIFEIAATDSNSPRIKIKGITPSDASDTCFVLNALDTGSSDFRFYNTGTTILGVTIGADAAPSSMLDVRGDIAAGIAQNATSTIKVTNTNTGVSSVAVVKAVSSAATIELRSHSSGVTSTQYGITLGSVTELRSSGAFSLLIGTGTENKPIVFGSNSIEIMRLVGTGNVKIAGSASRATTEGTNQLVIFDGTSPAGTLTNGVSIYARAGECYIMDAAGNETIQSPHEKETGQWIFWSKNTITGRCLRVDMEGLVKAIDAKLGGGFVKEYMEKVN